MRRARIHVYAYVDMICLYKRQYDTFTLALMKPQMLEDTVVLAAYRIRALCMLIFLAGNVDSAIVHCLISQITMVTTNYSYLPAQGLNCII